MYDLYSLSQILKTHRLYGTYKPLILKIYKFLSYQKKLDVENLLLTLKDVNAELFLAIQQNHNLLQKQSNETLKLKLQGVHFVCYGEELYPSQCYLMTDPPLVFSYVGCPAWLSEKTISVVGSREPAAESIQWMEKEFVSFCEKENPCVVSGGARGIDQKSHAVALRTNTPTIVVLPAGLGNVYPETLVEWMPAVLAGSGCFISEYAHSQRMHKNLFHHRNRLIAALGRATLLIEAKRRSGTLITAQQALQIGRPVLVVPGHPQDPHFSGSLDLLTEGATLIRDAEDLFMNFSAETMSNNFRSIPLALS